MTDLLPRHALKLGLVALLVVFTLRLPGQFATADNLKQVAISVSILLIVACSQAVLVLMGYVDLSVGSAVALTGVIAGVLLVEGWAWWLAIPVALGAGAAIGLLLGMLAVLTDLSPVIVTLGALTALRGVAQLLPDQTPARLGDAMAFLGRGAISGIPTSVLIAACVLAGTWVLVSSTPTGRHIYAIGVNREAAFISGIRIKLIPLLAYVFSGLTAGIGGVLFAARLDSAPAGSLGVGFEFDVLTAVLLGGVAFTGGRGTIGGVLVGVLFLGVLKNGMLLMNVSAYWQAVASGVALVLAAALDRVANRVVIKARTEEAGDLSEPLDPPGPSLTKEPSRV